LYQGKKPQHTLKYFKESSVEKSTSGLLTGLTFCFYFCSQQTSINDSTLLSSNSYGYSPHFKQPSSRPPRNYYPSFSYATNYYIPKEPMRSTQAASFPRMSARAAAEVAAAQAQAAAAANAGHHRRWQHGHANANPAGHSGTKSL
jgi:hypothetical protein